MQKFFELALDCDCLDQFAHRVILKKGTVGSVLGSQGNRVEIHILDGKYNMDKELFDKSIKKDSETSNAGLDMDFVWEQLKTVNDPEVNVNVVDLGLIYAIDVVPGNGNSTKIVVEMTLTSFTCPMGEVIQQEVVDVISSSCAVDEVIVNFVWDPPWHRDMITESGRMELGLQ